MPNPIAHPALIRINPSRDAKCSREADVSLPDAAMIPLSP